MTHDSESRTYVRPGRRGGNTYLPGVARCITLIERARVRQKKLKILRLICAAAELPVQRVWHQHVGGAHCAA